MRSFLLRAGSLSATAAVLGLSLVASEGVAEPLAIRNSFRVGTSGVLCSAQIASADKRLTDLFDKAYRLTCRDAAGAVGSVIAVRHDIALGDPAMGLTSTTAQCGAVETVTVEGIGPTQSVLCHDGATAVDYRRYTLRKGDTRYLSEGLAGYDPVLRLALASVLNNRPQPGEVSVASTEVADAAAFARVQAGSLDADGARVEAYARNNDGRFAESAEFFELLSGRSDRPAEKAELIANAGLQQSNLGNFSAAFSLFQKAEKEMAQSDGVTQRLLRNYRAINLLNQRFAEAALTILDTPMSTVQADYDVVSAREGVVSNPLADQINRENDAMRRLGGISSGLTPLERAATLDAQASELRGVALTQLGRLDEGENALARADRALLSIRNGRLTSALWLRSQIAMERASIAETEKDNGKAGGLYRDAVGMLTASYPDTPTLLAAQARQAGFLARSGDTQGSLTLFASVVDRSEKVSDSSTALRDLLSPYFALLVEQGTPDAAAALFKAAQSLQRPGVASTQAILARELSEGNDEAASLFRLAVARTREIGRTEVEITRISATTVPGDAEREKLEGLKQTLDQLRAEQTALTARLSAFPRYNVLSPTTVPMAELQAKLGAGEAYYKLAIIGDAAYAIYIDHDGATTYRIDQSRAALEDSVGGLRNSIVRIENGQVATYPFNIELARALYVSLFGPVAKRMDGVRHLIFEPDGPLLQLPPSLLVTDDASVAAYKARIARPNADEFDFTGTAWLGRNRESTIAVSPRAFINVRSIAPSKAQMTYLGLGNNASPAAFPAGTGTDGCDWPLATWQSPIDPAELTLASSLVGKAGSRLLTGAAFTDDGLTSSHDLAHYRILHFATHGLVTAPRPQCPARPALVTSFGKAGVSDGLLSFREIFDLKLDADLVILSACDTAGMATAAVSREAGIPTGGNYALDGLVRAFIGAGARSVIASHWPVPDDYGATKKLIGGLFGGKVGESMGALLDKAQMRLMDQPNTSHPFYWAAFVILGDAEKPLLHR
ncbi:MAG TPA: CHAT domain-containing protein [Sphingobium sp.]|uniref:CHAT domain-containing protein n=1 Tax=Sphingobium sp. TaxID=1912891 RepID=UPI002ED41042